jgi:hypothetical protein
MRMRKSWANCACAKIELNAHARKFGQVRMRKAYHLEGEAAVLHVFSVERAVLQLPLLQRMRKSWAYCACAKLTI